MTPPRVIGDSRTDRLERTRQGLARLDEIATTPLTSVTEAEAAIQDTARITRGLFLLVAQLVDVEEL